MIKRHKPQKPDILKRFNISSEEILTGVHCPNCLLLKMKRRKGSWIFPHCSFFSKDAHLNSLQDYYLLIDEKITNHSVRTFLELPSIYTASRLLKATNFKYTGSNKFRKYELNYDI